METFLLLSITGLIPVMVSIVLYFLFKKEKEKTGYYYLQQILIGIIFGIVAISGTELGVPFRGSIINARDAAPLCAALIFGGEAGIIAGLIGGIERWFAVLWGAGYYTRLACSVSTVMTGFIGALLKKYLFDNKMPDWPQAIIIGMICEVIHMVMIFVTNVNDVKTAFMYVSACSLPMITINALAVGIAVYSIRRIHMEDHQLEGRAVNTTPRINQQFQRILITVMLLGFAVTSLFVMFLQNNISVQDTDTLLRIAVMDTYDEVNALCDQALYEKNQDVLKDYSDNEDADLKLMAEEYGLDTIDIINSYGTIIRSSEPDNIGFHMDQGGSQSAEFMQMFEENGPESLVQDLMPTAKDPDIKRKYSGILYGDRIVEVSLSEEMLSDLMYEKLSSVASYRHIGETGLIVVLDSRNQIVSLSNNIAGSTERDVDIEMDGKNNTEPFTLYEARINGREHYYMFAKAEGYRIYAFLPFEEANFTRNISTYLNVFMESIVFGLLFVMIFMVIKTKIISNINEVNSSLKKITDGELDTVVDVKTNREFMSLSEGINTTVDALKRYIAEANARIDTELKYAKDIQSSALPSIFPHEEEYELYALMDPAREVGGDFYDFYVLNRRTLVVLVADVSGKGIPASLFMMRAKTTIKTYAEGGVSVADIFTNANYQLCEGNDAEMFVTSWMGFLDLVTGELRYVNAGHNRPLLRRKGGDYEYMSGPAGFVLGGMNGIVYKEQRTMLEPGDELFLYTDGVVEATNVNKELYGDDRLRECINLHKDEDAKTLCESIKKDVDAFYEGAPQFDDITELSLKFRQYLEEEKE